MPALTKNRLRLLTIARDAGDRLFDVSKNLCLIGRDTLWYASSLLYDDSPRRRDLALKLISSIRSEDGTHTPSTMLSILHGASDRLDQSTRAYLREEIGRELVHAAETQWRDGNVNHPLGAYCTLVLGGELTSSPWAVDLGYRRLSEFQRLTGDRQFRIRRQAEMSEYNSPTYTALDILFLALIAEYAVSTDARALALFLEERLWLDEALHFHAPSGQFAGPHSRSYQDDSTGGFSSLHAVFSAASDREIFLDPSLCVTFNHPSSLLQCALTALVPMHMPLAALHLAWSKQFPLSMKKTTYCEQYHENSRRDGLKTGPRSNFAFDDEVYPGGLRDLTTFMTGEYALGTASQPYVNAGHSDSVMVRIRRSEQIRSMADFRSVYTRGVFNDACVGQRNLSHIAGTEIDESYLYEEGRCAAYQHRGRAIVFYAPKRSGHLGVTGFRLDVIFGYFAPFSRLVLGNTPVERFPQAAPCTTRMVFQDYRTYGVIIPLDQRPCSVNGPVRLRIVNNHLLFSIVNYEGSSRDWTREELTQWRNGFVIELATTDEYPTFDDFISYARSLNVEESVGASGSRMVSVTSPDAAMVAVYDPARELFLSRTWNDVEETVDHLQIEEGNNGTSPIAPLTLFGSEAMRMAP